MNFKTEYVQDNVANAGRFLVVSNSKAFCSCFTGTGDGKFLAVDGANGPNKIVWQQEIEVKENTTYFFSTWVSNLYLIKPAVLQFSVNGELLGQPFRCPVKQNVWDQFFVNWHSEQNTKATITIVSQNPDWNGNDFGLDRIKFHECVASTLEAELPNVMKDKVIELRNVLFETSKWEIIPTSYAELDLLVKYLQNNPTVEIEISGHTDNVGNDRFNRNLSEQRVQAIGKYLISKNVEAKRLVMKGYGMKLPIASNETSEGRQKNRRVEFKITKL